MPTPSPAATAPAISALQAHARQIRREILQMVARVKSSHIGGSFSVTDILTALYFGAMNVDPAQPNWPGRDRLIFSKGHCAAALYATLAVRGFVPVAKLAEYFADGTQLIGHPTRGCLPGVEATSGSLGHGLPMGSGMAYAAKADGATHRVFVIMSDGECDEGAVWEAALIARQHALDNLVAVVDYNHLQGFGTTQAVADLEPFADKWRAFGWDVREVNGHDFAALLNTFNALPFSPGKPNVVIARTVKGKGVSFMENSLDWHYKYPQGDELERALKELNEAGSAK